MKILITGTSSGLGSFLYENMKSSKYDRHNHDRYKNQIWDLIIHTATNNSKVTNLDDLFDYKNSNITLTEKITKLKYKKLIFTSTTQVYQDLNPQLTKEHNFNEIFAHKNNFYSHTKLISESIIMNSNPKNIILRLGSMVGKNMKKNNVYKILFEDLFDLTLTPDSKLAFIDHDEVLKFIKIILDKNLSGVFNFTRNDRISIKGICEHFKKIPNKYGKFFFESKIVDIKKCEEYFAINNKSSIQVLEKLYES